MLGTLVNAAAIIAAGAFGLLLKGGLSERYKTILNQATGLAVLFVGAGGCIAKLILPEANPVLFIISLAAGGLLGTLLNIEGNLQKLGTWLQGKIHLSGKYGNFASGFVAASLVFCVGTMAVLGSIQSGVEGVHTILFAKSLLDGLIALVMASTLGIGVLFSSVSVLAYQGLLTLLAVWVSPFLTADMLREISIIGGILIAAIGLNMLDITKIKAGNLLPALLGPIIYYGIVSLF